MSVFFFFFFFNIKRGSKVEAFGLQRNYIMDYDESNEIDFSNFPDQNTSGIYKRCRGYIHIYK